MVVDARLSENALLLIRSEVLDGAAMVAVTRAILSGQYDPSAYESDILDVFQCVADESDDMVLIEFGEFNALPKYVGTQPNDDQGRKLEAIFKFYQSSFEAALAEFREKLAV